MNTFFLQYSQYEDGLISRFRSHWFLRNFANLSNEIVIRFLLQLGHLSSQFVRWYEAAKQGLEHETAKEILRQILRDEIPRRGPTHQDDRLWDLIQMGVSKERCLREPATRLTRQTVRQLQALTRYPQSDYDLRTMVALRVAGEVLVSETYQHVVGSMESRFGLPTNKSRFYTPHFEHDKKVEAGRGHVGSFDRLLAEFIYDERTLAIARRVAEQAFLVRYHLLDQFRFPPRD